MKAAVCRAFDNPLTIEELTLAAPGPDDIALDVNACAICHSDITYADGKWGGELPAVYGHEIAGTVTAVGDHVSDISVGDNVAVTLIRSCGTCHQCQRGDVVQCETIFDLDVTGPLHAADGTPVLAAMRCGGFAEKVVVHQSQAVVVPADLKPEVVALLSCGVITGYGAVVRSSSASANSDVVVVGAGGVGINVVQTARLAGARTITVVDLVDAKLDAMDTFGATHTVNGLTSDVAAEIRAVTEGRGASHVFVSVGSGPAIEAAVDYLAPGGELIIVGMPASGTTIEVDPVNLAAFGQRIIGTKMGSSHIAEDIPAVITAYQQGEYLLDELVSAVHPLHEINEAIASTRTGEIIRNVIVFNSADS